MYFRKVENRSMFYDANAQTFELARRMRLKMTVPELILWTKLKNRKIFDVKFRRQHPVGNYIVDFYCHEHKLAIEVDGEVHLDEERNEKDLGRTAELNKYGIKVIRFTNNDIFTNLESVIAKIRSTL